MLYDGQIKKVLKIIETENQNTTDSNNLPKINKTLIPENFNKQLVTINLIKGYEMRAGNETRDFTTAPIRGFRKDRIALIKQCGRRLRKRTPKDLHDTTTLQKTGLLDIIKNGM